MERRASSSVPSAPQETTVADAYLRLLAERGVDYLFANAGTDFPPLIEALVKAAEDGTPVPQSFAVPHENLAVAMAYGHAMVSGRAQAVMLHVSVGTANAICGLLNAARERVPMLLAAGRTPYSEAGHHGARNLYIHWAQEMFDQAAMLREIVKWDYELRMPDQVEPVLERALALARSEPTGPVYLTLPREVLAAPLAAADGSGAGKASLSGSGSVAAAVAAAPAAEAIAAAAAIIAAAERPVIITSSLGRQPAAVPLLAELAERYALPVVSHVPRWLCLPSDHPMHLGYDPAPFLAEADAVLVLESDVPWIASQVSPRSDAKIVHLGVDPLYGRYPVRGFRSDLTIVGSPAVALPMLAAALAPAAGKMAARIAARRERLAARRSAQRASWQAIREKVGDARPLAPAAVSQALDAIKGEDGIVVNELGVALEHMTFTKPGTYFASSPAGGLGWGLGAALGAKLAAPDRLVIAAVGDGSYMFGNPTPAHYVARARDLPVLFVVFNNSGWAAVRKATHAMYPEGRGQRANRMPLATLEPSPAFEKVAEASGGYGERVEAPEELMPALARALHAVRVEKRQALLNISCGLAASRLF